MANGYLETISLVERLHRQFLEVVKLELEGLRIHDINNVQGLMLFNIGDAEMTVGELTLRGCYLGSNVSYNVKKLVENGYLVQERSVHDRRSIHVRLTDKGRDLRDRLSVMHQRHVKMLSQTAITEDLYAARDAAGGQIVDEAADVRPHDLTSGRPYLTYEKGGVQHRVDCDYVAGCDGYHGVSRASIPADLLKSYEKSYPFGWLGIMSETPPYKDMCYCYHDRGFALASMRNPMLSRYYIQCDLDAKLDDWPDDRFWEEFKARCPKDMADAIVTGPSIEKSIAPLRSFVAEPMRYGGLFLAGDAAHIVPPTGAKGLNLAVSDVFYLSRALTEAYRSNKTHYLDCYSDMALRRVWASARVSWWLTLLLHRFPDETPFERQMRFNQFDYLQASEFAQASLAEQYAGLPFES